MNAFSNNRGKGSSATYWRRRFIALVAGLAIFGVLAWSVSGALAKPKIINPAANVVSGKHHPAGGSGAAAGATATSTPAPSPAVSPAPAPDPAPGTAAASPTAAGTAGHPVRKHPKSHSTVPVAGASGAPGTSASGNPAAGGGRVTRKCSAGHIVLSLFASQPSYRAHADPQFTVDVVSTGREACTFNVGATHLSLMIRTAAGRVWNSADCAAGRKSLPTDLVPGVPTAMPISWNRKTSSPGCKVAASKVPAGFYAATASSGSITSNKEIFRIR
ncbi:MAG TPA: hypothetical protein VK599_02125 [Streptosporangiaceae bacterium]|nr:hypothetical protein [Streptosporangiaceae bacterium]